MGYKYFVRIIDFLIVLIVVSGIFRFSSLISIVIISSILSPFSKFESVNNLVALDSPSIFNYSISFISVSNLSVSFIFFLVIFLNSISSLILYSLSQNLFFIVLNLSFSCNFSHTLYFFYI